MRLDEIPADVPIGDGSHHLAFDTTELRASPIDAAAVLNCGKPEFGTSRGARARYETSRLVENFGWTLAPLE